MLASTQQAKILQRVQLIAQSVSDEGRLPKILLTWAPLALWRTYPPTTNYGQLPYLHQAAITDLQWSLVSPVLYTVSADKTMNLSDLTTGQRIKKIRAHRGIINSLARSNAGHGIELVATASDDGTVKVWECGDEGSRDNVASWELGCPVTSVCWGPDGNSVFVGALDNLIHVRFHRPFRFICLNLV